LILFVLPVQWSVRALLQGDLKTFLRATSHDRCDQSTPVAEAGRLPPLSVAQRITMCGQIALGMEHIADRGLSHRDLAARNVLLSPSLHLKVRPSTFHNVGHLPPNICRRGPATKRGFSVLTYSVSS